MLLTVFFLAAFTLSGQVADTSSSFYGNLGSLATPGFTLNNPSGVAHYFSAAETDLKGSLLIADTGNHRILAVNLNTGVVTRVAGTGQPGFSGDGGLAATAQLNSPVGLAVDGTELYVADRDNQRVRHISLASGMISTIAGNGTAGFSGDGGQGHLAALHGPTRIAVRGNSSQSDWNIAIADSANHRIRSLDMRTRVITTVAGTGIAGFSGDGGPAVSAQLNGPEGVAYSGGLLIADTGNRRLRRIDETGKITSDNPPDPPFARPVSVRGSYIADPGDHRVHLRDGTIGTGVPGRSPDGTPLQAAQLNGPQDLVSSSGRDGMTANWPLWIADTGNHVIRYWTRCGTAGPLEPSRTVKIFSGCPADFTLNLAAGEEIVLYATPPFFGPLHAYFYRPMVAVVKRPDGATVATNTFTSEYTTFYAVVLRYPAVGTIPATISGPHVLSVSQNSGYSDGGWIRYEKTGTNCRLIRGPFGVPESVPASTGGFVLRADLPPGCSLPVTSNVPWLRPGSLTLSYGAPVAVDANPSRSQRVGGITIGDVSFTLSQKGTIDYFCVPYLLAPMDSPLMPWTGGNVTVQVLSSGDTCAWEAASTLPWLRAWPSSGNGTASTTIYLEPNFSGNVRTAVVSIGGRNFNVTQAANPNSEERRFVQLLYHRFFGRMPSDAEITFQTSVVLPRYVRAMTFLSSDEFRSFGRYAAGLYIGILNRDAEYGGWKWQRDALVSRAVSHHQIVSNFLGSAEFIGRVGNLSDADFVRLMYRQILFREATDAEVQFQAGALAQIGRTQLTKNFLDSDEFNQQTTTRVVSTLVYLTLLGRDASPGEREWATAMLRAGMPLQNLVQSFVGSGEFRLSIE